MKTNVQFPPYPAPNFIGVKVICSNGNHWTTQINATLEEAKAYYLGKTFGKDTVSDVQLLAE